MKIFLLVTDNGDEVSSSVDLVKIHELFELYSKQYPYINFFIREQEIDNND